MHQLFRQVLDEFASEPALELSGIQITQQNLVLVVYFGKTAEIQNSYVEHHPECRSSKETFPSLTLRFGRPKVTMMQFPSGQTVFVGGPNYPSTLFVALVYRIRLEIFRVEKMPHILKSSLVFGHPNKANLVFTARIPGGPFDLGKFYANVPGVRYNPRKFPGANLTITGSNGAMLGTAVFFEGGLLNFMGCKSPLDARIAVDFLATQLQPYACGNRELTDKIVETREQEREEAVREATLRRSNAPAQNYAQIMQTMEENALLDALMENNDDICLE
jgi:TATA-box binding protein (TBP) (component of TFIID and TFIIIB)